MQTLSKGKVKVGSLALGGGVVQHVKRLRVNSVSGLGASEVDTGYDLPVGAIVTDCFINVRTAEATASTKTIDVGILASETGDADGFIDGASTAATGIILPAVTVTTGSNTKFFAATNTIGALLADHQAGTDVDQDEGVFARKRHLIVTGKQSVSYTLGDAATELVCDIYITFLTLS